MILNNEQVRDVYDRIAGRYDTALLCYRALGLDRVRRGLVSRLGLKEGTTVVDLGCGTGANFPALADAVGPDGRIVGVDLSDAMLAQARARSDAIATPNVDLVRGDLRDFAIPGDADAVISTFSLEMVPDHEAVIDNVARSLAREGRLGLLGLKLPESWPRWAVDLGLVLNRPFGVNRSYAAIKPWIAVEQRMQMVEFSQHYFGAMYRCVATPETLPAG